MEYDQTCNKLLITRTAVQLSSQFDDLTLSTFFII